MTKQDAIPFFRPSIGSAEIRESRRVLESGWLTTGKRCEKFEAAFADYVGVKHAVAVNSCTAALHLALEAVGFGEGDLALVPTMTFAATAEVVQYLKGLPVLVDSVPESLCMDPAAARRTLEALGRGERLPGLKRFPRRKGKSGRPGAGGSARRRNGYETPFGIVRAILPVHYGGQMAEMKAFRDLAKEYDLYLIEDAAHSLPAAYRETASKPWRSVGTTGDITCFSFYANKTITTGEGGMAVTDCEAWAERMRRMSLHGLSKDASKRFHAGGTWYYEITSAGFKYNMTDLSAGIGIHQLRKADRFARERERVAELYVNLLGDVPEIELPVASPNRKHSWHLFVIRLNLERLRIGRAEFIDKLRARKIGTSVHWMPLHMHPHYRETFGFKAEDFPVARAEYERIVSLPIYPALGNAQVRRVASAIKEIIADQKA
jgi:dTDP-4-amino-4,6-dideoxygalactose transaminase